MYKHQYKPRMRSLVSLVLVYLLASCGDPYPPGEQPAPDYLSVSGALSIIGDRSGDFVIVEGVLIIGEQDEYKLRSAHSTGSEMAADELSLTLDAGGVDFASLEVCISKPAVVFGALSEPEGIDVKYIKLLEDIRSGRFSSCYSRP